MGRVIKDMRAYEVNKNIFRDRKGSREGLRLVDPTCVKQVYSL